MKTAILFAALLLAPSAFAANHSVAMKSISFDPKQLEIKVGDTVEWNNISLTDHSATSNDDKFDTGSVTPKKSSKPIAFKEAGTYAYHCRVHGKAMSGVITVKASQ